MEVYDAPDHAAKVQIPPMTRDVIRIDSPPDVLCQRFLAGVEFVAEGTLVLLLWEGSITGVLLLMDVQVGFGGVALEADVTLEWLLPCVHSGVTLIFTFKKKIEL